MLLKQFCTIGYTVVALALVLADDSPYNARVSAAGLIEQAGPPPPPHFVTAHADGARVTLVFESSAPPPLPRSFVVEAGTGPGLSDLAVFEGGLNLTTFTFSHVPAGTYHVRAREKNANGVSPPSNERALSVVGCSVVPGPPSGLGALVQGQSVTILWPYDPSGCAPSAYVFEAGSAPGQADLGAIPISVVGQSPSVNRWSLSFHGIPPGVYYARLRGINSVGTSAPSPDLTIAIPSPCLTPAKAVNFQAPTLGNSVTFSWSLEPGTFPPSTSYPAKTFIEAGAAPGASDLAVFEVPAGFPRTVWGPPGTYWTRVRTANACGSSVVSDDVMVTLTSECVLPGRPKGLDITGRPANQPSGALARWHTPATGGVVSQYIIDLGTAPGLTNVRSQAFPGFSGPMSGGIVENLPAGTFFGRVRAANVCGSGPASSEARLIVGGTCEIVAAPTRLDVLVNGQSVELRWPTGGSEGNQIFPGSIVEIGTAEGANDVIAGSTGPLGGDAFNKTFSTTLPPGHYFARVKLTHACGVSNPSIEIEFTITP